MKPFIVLIAVFLISLLAKRLTSRSGSIISSGRIALGAMLIFTGIAHFTNVAGMQEMLPGWIPQRQLIVWLTGGIEFVFALALFFRVSPRFTSTALILFFVAMLPANIYAALHHIDPLTGSTDGHGPEYLLFRIPLQVFFIAWTYLFTRK